MISRHAADAIAPGNAVNRKSLSSGSARARARAWLTVSGLGVGSPEMKTCQRTCDRRGLR